MVERGQLINVFTATIYRVDTAAIAAVVGGGYDDEFGETVPVDNGTQTGASSRREEAVPLSIPVQLDRDMKWHESNLKKAGIQDVAQIVLIMFMADLEDMGLVNIAGKVQLFKGDRVDKIETTDGELVEEWTSPELFILSHEKAGYGLDPGNDSLANLLYVYCGQDSTSGGAT